MADQIKVYTIGYQGRSVEEVMHLIAHYNIALLVDVRSKPYGRRFEFNRKALEAIFPGYRWMGDRLGGFSTITDQAIADLADLARSQRVLLMCMERLPKDCHRSYELAERLRVHDIEAIHL